MLLFGDGVLGSFSDFPALWGSEIKPFGITHLSQESGKGSEELLEAVVVVLLFQLEVERHVVPRQTDLWSASFPRLWDTQRK